MIKREKHRGRDTERGVTVTQIKKCQRKRNIQSYTLGQERARYRKKRIELN